MVTFLSEEDSASFRDPVARFLKSLPDSGSSVSAARATSNATRQVWSRMAQELGLLGVAIPENYGGLGLSLAHTAIVSEELGRQLSGTPFLASAGLASCLLLNLADPDECREILPTMIDGTCIATVALHEAQSDGGHPREDRPADRFEMTAAPAAPGVEGVRLTGRKLFVLNGMEADLFLVVARSTQDPDRQVLALVSASAPGLTRRSMTVLDTTRPVAQLDLLDTPGRILGRHQLRDFATSLGFAVAQTSVLLSAESVGAASFCLDLCVEYAKMRQQFGHAIGSFQAVQHRMADMFGELESARAAVEVAAGSADDPAFPMMAAVARARSADGFALIAKETIQLHGGIGFTWEHPAHRYFKRSLSDLQLLGHPAGHRQQVSKSLLAAASVLS